jgi:hypothetical protein
MEHIIIRRNTRIPRMIIIMIITTITSTVTTMGVRRSLMLWHDFSAT